MSKSVNNTTKIAIIGGGIAGSSVALQLGRLGLDVTLFEKLIKLNFLENSNYAQRAYDVIKKMDKIK